MLSNAAFNALLKTLEEPPPYALFIFATTEPNKVLPTILSRCQRFDFRRISVPEIVSHLTEICKTENIQADEASLMLIAQKGDGALRDSLSAFDQAVSLCGTSLIYTELAQAFGVVDVDLFFEVTQHVVAGNSAGLLTLVDNIIRQGYDLQEFLIGLSSHLRNLLVAHTMNDTSLVEVAEAVKQQYATESQKHSETDLLRLLMVVADGEDKLKTSAQPRLQLELTLLKMAAMAHAVDLKQALKRLEQLESGVSEGKVVVETKPAKQPEKVEASPPVVARMVVSDAPPSGDAPTGFDASQPSAAVEAEPAQAAFVNEPPQAMSVNEPPQAVLVSEPVVDIPPPAPITQVAVQETITAATAPNEIPLPDTPPLQSSPQQAEPAVSHDVSDYMAPVPQSVVAIEAKPDVQPETTSRKSYQGLFGAPALRKVQTSGPAEPVAAATAENEPSITLTEAPSSELTEITKIWPEFLKHIKVERIHVSALLQHARPVQLQGETLVFSVPDDFHKRMLANQQEFLLDHLCNFVMVPIERTSFVIDMAGSDEMLEKETPSEIDPYEYMQKKRQESPIIRSIFDDFGGEMVW